MRANAVRRCRGCRRGCGLPSLARDHPTRHPTSSHQEASDMSELPRRASRRSTGQPDHQPNQAGTSTSDASTPAPTAPDVGGTDARPVAILEVADIEAIAARVAELLDRPPRRLLKVDEVAALLA